jgi:hypothetical protein
MVDTPHPEPDRPRRSPADPCPEVPPAAWRQAVITRVSRLRAELDGLAPTRTRAAGLADLYARLACVESRALNGPDGVRRWWSGSEIELAWGELRVVEEEMVAYRPDGDLDAAAADAVIHARFAGIDDADDRLLLLQGLRLARAKDPHQPPPDQMRAAITEVLRASHDTSTRAHIGARTLRNRLFLTTGLLLLFAILLVVAQALTGDTTFVSTPEEWDVAPWAQLLIAMLFGMIGALFTAIPAMASVRSDSSPFNLPLPQSLVKVALGAVTAVAGLGAIEAVGGPDTELRPDSVPQLLALAFLFGAAQQTVTRYIDARAKTVLAATDTSTVDTDRS